ncbi:LytR/AlgR family response regulator transcription factor [Reichenbachiella ulvae]|uniref:LytTR family DNA-binding domain-containing protein n=1 Tax=Reichenbachiella ulvae TaxID=2980104 RepID=A0ABT3CQK6_9BACT|nr:LytTR family DNA-binding domain-containing protein [Reichenbachiella ulvae]MCV9385985.1 LytTR family DNA-binding domain-containing protein [Reichenbachiella ulvae]
MKALNAIIIEDEEKQSLLLQNLLKQNFPEIKVMTTCDSVLAGTSAIKQYQPDLLFMDVMINGGTSFDIIEAIPQLDAEVIFTTSFEQYAIRAFRLSAVDFLLKPIAIEELNEAIEKARTKILSERTSAHLQLLISNFRNPSFESVKIALPTYKGYSFVKPDEIIRCESDNTYTTFFLTDQREILVSKTLKHCEQMLETYSFCRVHNSSLINLKYITEYERGEGGIVKMSDGSEIAVSRRRKEHFLYSFKSQLP